MTHTLLEHVWSDTFQVKQVSELSPAARILAPLLAAPTLCFTSDMFPTSLTAVATYAGTEVMPGATLADVLFEEHGIEATDDTIIYIEPTELGQAAQPTSDELGWIIGQVLVNLANPTNLAAGQAVLSDPQNLPAGGQYAQASSALAATVQ